MKRIAHLDEYDISAVIDLKEKVDGLLLRGLPFSYRGCVFSSDMEGNILVNDKKQTITVSTSSARLIKFIIDYAVISESM